MECTICKKDGGTWNASLNDGAHHYCFYLYLSNEYIKSAIKALKQIAAKDPDINIEYMELQRIALSIEIALEKIKL